MAIFQSCQRAGRRDYAGLTLAAPNRARFESAHIDFFWDNTATGRARSASSGRSAKWWRWNQVIMSAFATDDIGRIGFRLWSFACILCPWWRDVFCAMKERLDRH